MKKPLTEKSEITILGVDPGSNIMGYSVIVAKGKNDLNLLCMDVLHLSKIKDPFMRLKQIYLSISRLIDEYKPAEIALEAPFFGKNVQSMLKLGRAQGMAMAPAILREIPIYEYPPKQVKQSITGNGNASKEQVAEMLKQQVHFDIDPKYLDATDALATAVCHYHQSNNLQTKGKAKSWNQFIAEHPDRLK